MIGSALGMGFVIIDFVFSDLRNSTCRGLVLVFIFDVGIAKGLGFNSGDFFTSTQRAFLRTER